MSEVNEKATQSPPNAENAAEQVTVTEPQEPTTEQLKQAVLTLTEQGVKDKQEVKRLQGVIRSQGVTKQDISALRQEFGGMQEWVAEALDKQNQGGAGEFNEKPTVSYKEQLAAVKKASQSQEQPADPDAQLFFGYAISQGLTLESPEVIEAMSDGRTGKEAFEQLKGTIAGKSEAARKAEITAEVQKSLKLGGYTQGGVGAPNTGSAGFTKESIKNMPDDELIEKSEAILKAMTVGELK